MLKFIIQKIETSHINIKLNRFFLNINTNRLSRFTLYVKCSISHYTFQKILL